MPRKARLDAPGLLHHIIVRGIERRDIFVGYAVYFNRRHNRCGHLFQNRYKSFVVDVEAYLLELMRYIHLNPVRAKLLEDIDALEKWPFSGHAILMGVKTYPWFDDACVLSLFGGSHTHARARLAQFMVEGLAKGRRPDLVGGGLERSLAALAPSERTSELNRMVIGDERILGCGGFAEAVLAALKQNEDQGPKEISLVELIEQVALHFGHTLDELCSGTRRRAVVKARAAVIWFGVKSHGFSANALSEALSISRTCIYEILNLGRG